MKTQWPEIARIFDEIVRLPHTQRADALREATDDASLRRAVRVLLDADDRSDADGFLDLRDVATSTEDPPLPDRVGRYRVTGLLGCGGMGVVLAGFDDRVGRPIAIKLLDRFLGGDAALQRLLRREAKLLGAVQHPNVATLYSLEEAGETWLLTMELVDGTSLDRWIAQEPRTLVEVLHVLRQVALALRVVHAQGVVHRDLKPENVIVDRDGHATLVDFGIGRFVEPRGDSRTTTTMVGGTPGYMSPEQLNAQGSDLRTDLWSFGCLAFHCLAGRSPFHGDRPGETIADTLREEPRWELLPPGTPGVLRTLLGACLQKDRGHRPASADDLVTGIDAALAVLSERSDGGAVRCRAPGEAVPGRTRTPGPTPGPTPGSAPTSTRRPVPRPPHRAPRARRRALRIAALLLLIALVGWIARSELIRLAEPTLEDGALRVTAPVIGTLWESRHESPVSVMLELDWPGARTLVYGLWSGARDGGTLFACDLRTGATRWTFAPDLEEAAGVYEFAPGSEGTLVQAGAFKTSGVEAADLDGDGVHELVVRHTHDRWYPAVLTALTPAGDVLGTYYSAGHLGEIHVVDIDGDERDEVIAGGTNNDLDGATLVLLDRDHWHGQTWVPSSTRLGPGPDGSLARVVLPPLDDEIRAQPDASGRMWVRGIAVSERSDGSAIVTATLCVTEDAGIVMTFDAALRPLRVSTSDSWIWFTRDWPPAVRERALSQDYLEAWMAGARLYGTLHE